MELGVSEEYAHKLATDRNMTDIKNMSHDDVASTLGISKDAEEFINTMQIIAEQGSRRRAAKKSTKITIRAKAIDDIDRPEITSRFNALNHVLVPHQELVGDANISPEDQLAVEMEALAPWKMIQPDAETADSAAHMANPDHTPLAAGWIADRVLKVVRQSPSAGQTVAYRLIVEGN